MQASLADKVVFVSTGEISGDRYASLVVASLKKICPEASVVALGGEELLASGAKLLGNTQYLATVGFWEAFRSLSKWWSLFKRSTDYLLSMPPDCVLLVDNPGFNLRLARFCHQRKLPVVYFVPPQVWVWGKSRAKKLSRWADSICTIFPWEKEYFDSQKTLWVGHPVAWLVDQFEREQEKRKEPNSESAQKVLLLPGSRVTEIETYLERVLPALRFLSKRYPFLSWNLVAASSGIKEMLHQKLRDLPLVLVEHEELYPVAKEALFSISCSGTVTLELALLGVPQIIVYRVSGFTYRLAKLLVKSQWVGLPNLLAQREICPELVQEDFKPERLLQEVEKLLGEIEERKQKALWWKERLKEILYRGNPFENVAQVVREYL